MSQRIEGGAPAHTQIYVYIDMSPKEKKGKDNTPDTLTSIKQNFTHLPGLFVLTLASEAPWQALHRCNIAPAFFFRIRVYKDDPILDDLI